MPTSSKLRLASLLCLAAALSAPAQTLAHRNWAGSGLTQNLWWRSAVFYRIDPAHFQDSTGNGVGDLAGIALRLDYLQSLGVDAIILLPSSTAAQPDPADPGFDTLLTSASQRHLRLIVALRSSTPSLLDAARSWLTRGAAGIEILAPTPANLPFTALNQLLKTFPGQRVLLAGFTQPLTSAPPIAAGLVETPLQLNPPQLPSLKPSSLKPNSLPAPLLLTDPTSAPTAPQNSPTQAPAAEPDPAATLSLNETAAILLLTTPGAVSLLYGQELGLPQPLDANMQWTPTNLTPPHFTEPTPAEPLAASIHPKPAPAPRPNPSVYGAFVPYVAPKLTRPQPVVFDPAQLRGFSTHPTPSDSTAPTVNAALEDRDPSSLLNFYRRLIQLHHDNLTLRSGTVVPLHHGVTLAWLRVLPSHAEPPILIVCNPSSQPIAFDPSADLAPFHARHLALHNLLTSAPGFAIETTDTFTLPPHTVYLGQVYR
jgi:hypothetical protein